MTFTAKAATALAVADRIAEAATDDLLVTPRTIRVAAFADDAIPHLRRWLASMGVTDIVAGPVWHTQDRREYHADIDGVRVTWAQPVRVTVTVDEE